MRIFCPAIVCSISLRVIRFRDPDRIGRTGAWEGSSLALRHFAYRVAAVMLHHCSAVKPATRASGSRTCVAHGCARPFPGCWCGKLCSAACGLGPCAFAPPMHCPGSDPGAREAPAGMWNLTSLRAARACRKLGRVAPRTLPADGSRVGARDGGSRREKVGLNARWSGVVETEHTFSTPDPPSRRLRADETRAAVRG